MKNHKGHTPHLEVILRKMCSMAGVDYDETDFVTSSWYLQACWAETDQNRFIDWLTDYLYKNTAARDEIMDRPVKIKTKCREAAKGFTWNYGWALWG